MMLYPPMAALVDKVGSNYLDEVYSGKLTLDKTDE